MRILLVEDDELLGSALCEGLRQAGFAVDWLKDGEAARTALVAEEFAGVVLDLGLPRLSGLDLIRWLRGKRHATPVLVLTSRDAVEDRVAGLDLGADDYVVKPAAISELAARLRALIRRSQSRASGLLVVGDVSLDLAARVVRFRGSPVELSAREFDVLCEFMLNAGRVLTRDQLEAKLYEWDRAVESNAIEVFVHHLRRKLDPDVIRTVRGVGYLMPDASKS
ncbi:MAG TPA: response regulator transcription factor [Steroidobacteraceae bacterium]|jgi:two-component system OmpR family response regulator/two-component system response regulator QseB|nr:response regulator transcription factor [Steroidobacteraceae bacterium]